MKKTHLVIDTTNVRVLRFAVATTAVLLALAAIQIAVIVRWFRVRTSGGGRYGGRV